MSAYRTFPNTEALASYIVRSASISGLVGVYSSIPKNATDASFPMVTIQRIGGVPPVRRALDMANIQVDVWGTSKTTAFNIAEAARRALHGADGTVYTTGGGAPVDAFVSGVEDSMGLAWLPDPSTGRDRYVFAVNMYASTR